MWRMQSLPPPSSNPISRILGLAVGLIVLAGAAVIGTFVLAVAVGVALIAGLALYLRIRWLQRKARRGGQGGPRRPDRGSPPGEIIEGEFRVEPSKPTQPHEHQR